MQYSKEKRHLQWQERRCFKYNQEVDTIKEKKKIEIYHVTTPMKVKMIAPWKKSYGKARQHIKKVETSLYQQSPSNQSYGFSSSNVLMWELDHKES